MKVYGDRIMYNENNIDRIIGVILSSKGYHKVPILQEGTNCYLKRYSDKLVQHCVNISD